MRTIKVDIKNLSKKTHTPIFGYCRKLIKDGEDPNSRLECYRGDMFCLSVDPISEGARLTVKEDPYPHFVKVSERYLKI